MNAKITTYPIDAVLSAFAGGDVENLLRHIDDQIDFRIDHYQDEADISWQKAADKAGLIQVLQRLAAEVFPQGTRILSTSSTPLGNDWVITKLHQQFYYGVQDQEVDSLTWIVSHSEEGRVDYFRETVTNVVPVAA